MPACQVILGSSDSRGRGGRHWGRRKKRLIPQTSLHWPTLTYTSILHWYPTLVSARLAPKTGLNRRERLLPLCHILLASDAATKSGTIYLDLSNFISYFVSLFRYIIAATKRGLMYARGYRRAFTFSSRHIDKMAFLCLLKQGSRAENTKNSISEPTVISSFDYSK